MSLVKTKKRIASVSSTKKITKAMELIATVKLSKEKNTMLGNKSYSGDILATLKKLYSYGIVNNEFSKQVESSKKAYIVISSNLGLCASYNSNIFKYFDSIVTEEDDVFLIGAKGAAHYKNLGKSFEQIDDIFADGINLITAQKLSDFMVKLYKEEKYESVNVIYTHYINSLKFEPNILQFLPINIQTDKENGNYPPIFEPSLSDVVNELMPIYLDSVVYQIILESEVSEQASRRNAMENANDNADELLDTLTLEYNKARQTQITNQITEVTSASNATK